MEDAELTASRKMGVEDTSDRLYRNKAILAPMVRAGTLPFRALALRYGADTVFTEEIIDRRVVNAVRTENPILQTVDYVESRGKKGSATPFQTCALERDRVVYQIGTGDAANALRAAQHVERDVAAVDINMGCPKRFSLQGGMGAALLKRPEVAADIVGTLRRNLSVPVSVKIRLLDTPTDTVEFARRMEKAGACALTVHVRQLEDKPASKARWEELRPVVDAVNIPVIANGDVYTRADMASIKALSGCCSVMLARPALLNCSVFKPEGELLPLKEVIQQYLRECTRYDSIYQSAKYTVMEMITKRRHPDHLKASISVGLPAGAPGMREVTAAKTLEQLAVLWDVGSDHHAELARRKERAEHLGQNSNAGETERDCIHKFDDAYFLEPEAAKNGSRATSGRDVAVEGDRSEGAEKPLAVQTPVGAGDMATVVPVPESLTGGTDGEGRCNGNRGACSDAIEKQDLRLERREDGPGGEREAGGRCADRAVSIGGGLDGCGGGSVAVSVERPREGGDCVGRGGEKQREDASARTPGSSTSSKRPRKEEASGMVLSSSR